MNSILVVVLTLYGLKIAWNLALPYILAWQTLRAEPKNAHSVSLMPDLEIGLLLLAVFLCGVGPESTRLCSPWHLAIAGSALIASSYLHLRVVGAALGWMVSRARKSEASSEEGS